jgi:hypothetical protein
MGPLQILELILLAMEKGPEVVKAVKESFANEAEPTIEDIVKRINLVAPAWQKDEDDPDMPIEPDED